MIAFYSPPLHPAVPAPRGALLRLAGRVWVGLRLGLALASDLRRADPKRWFDPHG